MGLVSVLIINLIHFFYIIHTKSSRSVADTQDCPGFQIVVKFSNDCIVLLYSSKLTGFYVIIECEIHLCKALSS